MRRCVRNRDHREDHPDSRGSGHRDAGLGAVGAGPPAPVVPDDLVAAHLVDVLSEEAHGAVGTLGEVVLRDLDDHVVLPGPLLDDPRGHACDLPGLVQHLDLEVSEALSPLQPLDDVDRTERERQERVVDHVGERPVVRDAHGEIHVEVALVRGRAVFGAGRAAGVAGERRVGPVEALGHFGGLPIGETLHEGPGDVQAAGVGALAPHQVLDRTAMRDVEPAQDHLDAGLGIRSRGPGEHGVGTVVDLEPGGDEIRIDRRDSLCSEGDDGQSAARQARAGGIEIVPPDRLEERPGLGVTARVGARTLALGRRSFVVPGEVDDEAVWVSEDGVPLGRLTHADPPRPEAREALEALRAMGIDRFVLLTGDREEVARRIGETLGIDEVIAGVLPEGKLDVVRREQAAGRTVLMIGDGVNDALALSGADIGVAIGAEINEVALGGADVALLGADLGRLPELLRLAEQTRGVVNTNIAIGLGAAAVLVPLAALGLVNPLLGALLGSLATVAVVSNSARLLRQMPSLVA